jgi:hypothetical protein
MTHRPQSVSVGQFSAKVQEAVKAAAGRHSGIKIDPDKDLILGPWIIGFVLRNADLKNFAAAHAFAEDVASHVPAIGGAGGGAAAAATLPHLPATFVINKHILCGFIERRQFDDILR